MSVATMEVRVSGAAYFRGSRPSRLILSWDIGADWSIRPELEDGNRGALHREGKDSTRVELEHRKLDRYGARREEMRRIFETEGDWGRLLAMFAARAAAEASA